MSKKTLLLSLGTLLTTMLFSATVFAAETTGTISTGVDTGLGGTVITSPTFAPVAGTYTVAQSVTLTATGSSAICYRNDGSAPVCGTTATTCAAGSTLFTAPVSVPTTMTLQAVSCYPGNAGVVASSAVTVSSYTIAAGGGGGGGGGGGAGNPLPSFDTTASNILEIFTNTVQVKVPSTTKRPTQIGATDGPHINIPTGTHLTNITGGDYTGTISVPTMLSRSSLPKPLPTGLNFDAAILIRTSGLINFSQDITITIPIPDGIDRATAQVYFYNETTNEYEPMGGIVSADGKTITFTTNHLSTYVVADAGGMLVPGLPFTDIYGHWAVEFIRRLYDMGVVEGRTSTTFVPNGDLNRAEIVKIALLTFGYDVPEITTKPFPDVAVDAWYAKYVAAAKEAGIISGFPDGKFRPVQSVIRAEAMKIMANASRKFVDTAPAAPFTDVEQAAWYAPFINFAFEAGIVSGKTDKLFGSWDVTTRAEMTKIAVKLLDL